MIDIYNTSNKDLFKYGVIAFVIFYIILKASLAINALFALIISIIVIGHWDAYNKTQYAISEHILQEKQQLLRPNPKLINKYDEMVNFLFSIQDFYVYNPRAYEEMVNFINNFFDCYEEVLLDSSVSGIRYNDMRSF